VVKEQNEKPQLKTYKERTLRKKVYDGKGVKDTLVTHRASTSHQGSDFSRFKAQRMSEVLAQEQEKDRNQIKNFMRTSNIPFSQRYYKKEDFS